MFRLAALVIAAPAGGIAYYVLEHYSFLMMSAPWFAGVTTLQDMLIMLPLALIRSHGYRFTKQTL